jgi:hypothetical protein
MDLLHHLLPCRLAAPGQALAKSCRLSIDTLARASTRRRHLPPPARPRKGAGHEDAVLNGTRAVKYVYEGAGSCKKICQKEAGPPPTTFWCQFLSPADARCLPGAYLWRKRATTRAQKPGEKPLNKLISFEKYLFSPNGTFFA